MNEYSISRSLKNESVKIYLNEDNDYIVLNPSDAKFMDKFAAFLRWLDELDAETTERAAEAEKRFEGREIYGKDAEGNEVIDTEQVSELASIQLNTYERVVEHIDTLFGDGTIRKYFKELYEEIPDFVPNQDCINDFITQISPALEHVYIVRNKKVKNKYNRNRKSNA